jgi:hypothetical protein
MYGLFSRVIHEAYNPMSHPRLLPKTPFFREPSLNVCRLVFLSYRVS